MEEEEGIILRNDWFLNFFGHILEKNDDDEKAVLDSQSLINLMKPLILAASGETKKNIYKHSRKVIEALLEDRASNFYKHFVIIFIPENKIDFIDRNFITKVRENLGKNVKFTVFKNPTNDEELEGVNNWAREGGWNDDEGVFIQNIPTTKYTFYAKSIFYNEWKYKFLKEETHMGYFYIGPNAFILVPTMKNYGINIRRMDITFNQLKCWVYRIPYKKRQCSMYIILPKRFASFQGLSDNIISFEETHDIINLMNRKGKYKYFKSITMPKFKHEKKYNLFEAFARTPECKPFTRGEGGLIHLNNMFTPGNLDIISKVNYQTDICIENDEWGTKVESKSEALFSDGVGGNELKINKPFVYCICDEKLKKILCTGIYTGRDDFNF